MFSKYLVYNKYKVNFNFIYLLRNCLLILICKILKYKKKIVKRYKDFKDEKVDNIIKKHIVIKI